MPENQRDSVRSETRSFYRWRALGACGLAVLGLGAGTGGCALVGYGAVMAEEAKKNKTHEVEAQYKGLEGKSFAVVVSALRYTQTDHPALVPTMTAEVTERLRDGVGHTGHVPAESLLRYLYEHPRWVAMPRGRLAQELGVERLVWIEVLEFRLHEPGNPYVWDGLAAASVGVIDPASIEPDEFVFERTVRVQFPDKSAISQDDMNADYVTQRLMQRLMDRVSWPLYKHVEPMVPGY